MAKRREREGFGSLLISIFMSLLLLSFVIAIFLYKTDVALLNPKGFIAQEQRSLLLNAVGIMLIVAVPTLFLLYFFAWKYRETNDSANRHSTHSKHKSRRNAILRWFIPAFTVFILALSMVPATYELDPHKPITSTNKPMTIQVVALRWKWLFIYPEQNIATVNFVQIPIDTPVRFELSADNISMSSFWIPHLGGQLYAMTGHVNKLNLIADTPGDYPGLSAEINGEGFADMKFTARASSQKDFDFWVRQVKGSPQNLDILTYESLLTPTERNPVALYASSEVDLYDDIAIKYSASHNHTE